MFPIPPSCGPMVRLQVVVARPEDGAGACGALLRECARLGATTALVCLTEDTAREPALRAEAARLGVRRLDLVGLAPADPRVAAGLDDAVSRFRPDVLVTPEADPDDPAQVAVQDAVVALGSRTGIAVWLRVPGAEPDTEGNVRVTGGDITADHVIADRLRRVPAQRASSTASTALA